MGKGGGEYWAGGDSNHAISVIPKAGSLKMNTALEYSTRVVQEGGAVDVKRVLLAI